MAWYYAPDNPMMPPFGMSPPYGQEPLTERRLEKEIKKLTSIYDQMQSAKKKQEKKKPRMFTFLETVGVTVLTGPLLFICYVNLVKFLQIAGTNFLMNLNVPH